MKPACRLDVIPAAHRLEPDFVLEERQNRLTLRPRVDRCELREPLARVIRLGPFMLFLVQLLEVHEGVLVLRIEPQHLVERLVGAVHESAAFVVEPEAQQHVRVLEPAQP